MVTKFNHFFGKYCTRGTEEKQITNVSRMPEGGSKLERQMLCHMEKLFVQYISSNTISNLHIIPPVNEWEEREREGGGGGEGGGIKAGKPQLTLLVLHSPTEGGLLTRVIEQQPSLPGEGFV